MPLRAKRTQRLAEHQNMSLRLGQLRKDVQMLIWEPWGLVGPCANKTLVIRPQGSVISWFLRSLTPACLVQLVPRRQQTLQSLSTDCEVWKTSNSHSCHYRPVSTLQVKGCRSTSRGYTSWEAAIVTGMVLLHCFLLGRKVGHSHFTGYGKCLLVNFIEIKSLYSLG